jgi:hypothetical protein
MRGVTEMKINGDNNWITIADDKTVVLLNDSEQRELLIWFKEHRLIMWRDIFCDDCPEVQ